MNYDKFIEGNDLQDIWFLSKAVEKDKDANPKCKNILIEPSDTHVGLLRGVATDGHVLHIVDPLNEQAAAAGITIGHWRVLKSTKKITWLARLDKDDLTESNVFPDYLKVIPTCEPDWTASFDGFSLNNLYPSSQNYAELIKANKNLNVNIAFLDSLGLDDRWNVKYFDKHTIVMFTNFDSTRTALFMTMRG